MIIRKCLICTAMYLELHKNFSGETVTSARSLSPDIELNGMAEGQTKPGLLSTEMISLETRCAHITSASQQVCGINDSLPRLLRKGNVRPACVPSSIHASVLLPEMSIQPSSRGLANSTS